MESRGNRDQGDVERALQEAEKIYEREQYQTMDPENSFYLNTRDPSPQSIFYKTRVSNFSSRISGRSTTLQKDNSVKLKSGIGSIANATTQGMKTWY